MGFILPSPDSPPQQTMALMKRKDVMQAELDAHFSVLSANLSTMNSPLVDQHGFPRADIDVYAVRHARVRIIELRNDLEVVMNDIGKALESVYSPSSAAAKTTSPSTSNPDTPLVPTEMMPEAELKPFARVDGVAPGSPAADAGLLREDLLLRFGDLTVESFTTSSFQPLAELVAAHENRPLRVTVQRGGEEKLTLSFTPRKGWGGRGLLGCHIVPCG